MKKITKTIITIIGSISATILGTIGLSELLFPPRSEPEYGVMMKQSVAQDIQSFNAQFTAYIGMNRTIAQIKSLYQVVTASNVSNPGHEVIIKYKENDSASEVDMTESIIAGLESKYRFKVSMDDIVTEDGYYDTITVTKHN